MPDVNPILDAIDHCLTDYEVSGDAMRWTPDAPDPTPADWREQWRHARPLSTEPEPVQAMGLWFAPLGTPAPVATPEEANHVAIRYILECYGRLESSYMEMVQQGIRDLAAATRTPTWVVNSDDIFDDAEIISSRSFDPRG